jgi:hypothetical protein
MFNLLRYIIKKSFNATLISNLVISPKYIIKHSYSGLQFHFLIFLFLYFSRNLSYIPISPHIWLLYPHIFPIPRLFPHIIRYSRNIEFFSSKFVHQPNQHNSNLVVHTILTHLIVQFTTVIATKQPKSTHFSLNPNVTKWNPKRLFSCW